MRDTFGAFGRFGTSFTFDFCAFAGSFRIGAGLTGFGAAPPGFGPTTGAPNSVQVASVPMLIKPVNRTRRDTHLNFGHDVAERGAGCLTTIFWYRRQTSDAVGGRQHAPHSQIGKIVAAQDREGSEKVSVVLRDAVNTQAPAAHELGGLT